MREVHNSPFKVVGIEDPDGVKDWVLAGRAEFRSQAKERTGVLLFAGDGLGSERIAKKLAAFRHAGAREPERGMVGDGQRDEFVKEVLGEVAATHVGELVGECGVQIFGAQRF